MMPMNLTMFTDAMVSLSYEDGTKAMTDQDGNVAWSDDNMTLTFTPNTNMMCGTDYTFTVLKEAQTFDRDIVIKFTTEDCASVELNAIITPTDAAMDVAVDGEVKVEFNVDMDIDMAATGQYITLANADTEEKVNVMGGSTAIGHPLGSTMIRLTGTLARILKDNKAKYGVANACVGGGQGVATVIENLDA